MVEAQDAPIVRRVCPGCSSSHKDIYYRRLTPMPDDFDLLDTLLNNWFDTDNALNVDFALYSTHLDAYYDTNRWTFCNFNDPGIGFPRDCGPSGQVNSNWNSYYRGGGKAETHAFLLPVNTSFQSQRSNIALGSLDRQSTVSQKGIGNGGVPERAIDGETVGIYKWGSTTWTDEQEDPFWQVELQHEATINKVFIWRCIHECRNGNKLTNIKVDVYDHVYGDIVASRNFTGGDLKVLKVVDFTVNGVGAQGEVVRITSETADGQGRTLSLAEVEIEGVLGDAEDHELFAEVDGDEYAEQNGVRIVGDKEIGHFDNGDYVTYSSLNFGPSGTTKSIILSYSKGTIGGNLEIRLGDENGEIIGTFDPSRTAGWHDYQTDHIPIKDVTGTHDMTFVARGINGVMNLESFELSANVYVDLVAKYIVDNDKNRARDIQCGYSALLAAFTAQIFDKVSDDTSSSSLALTAFLAFLDVDNVSDAESAVDDICASAQATVIDHE